VNGTQRLCLVGSLLLLAACGQQGALYLPEQTRAVVPAESGSSSATTPPAVPVTATQKDKESEQTKPSVSTP
jgi:predicted small lipoprotein YifL